MKVLIAEDDGVSRKVLETMLLRAGYEVVVTCNGRQALEALRGTGGPRLAILDWMMPEIDGVEVCRTLRATPELASIYVLLLTAKGSSEDIVAGLDAGADDYIIKPFVRAELTARLRAAERILTLQEKLSQRVDELQEALANIKHLQGLLPICAYCKKIRDDQNYWHQVESYICTHTTAKFSHGICPECFERVLAQEGLLVK